MSTFDNRGYQRKLLRTMSPELAAEALEYQYKLDDLIRQVAYEANYYFVPKLKAIVEEAKKYCESRFGTRELVGSITRWAETNLRRYREEDKPKAIPDKVVAGVDAIAQRILQELKNDPELNQELESNSELAAVASRVKATKDEMVLYMAAHAAVGKASKLYVASVLAAISKVYKSHRSTIDAIHPSFLGRLDLPAYVRLLSNSVYAEGERVYNELPG